MQLQQKHLIGIVVLITLIISGAVAWENTDQKRGGIHTKEMANSAALMESSFMLDTAPSAARMIAPEPIATSGDVSISEQKLIKTATLDIVVESTRESLFNIEAAAKERGGYVQSSAMNERPDGTQYGSITIFVPSDQLDTTLEHIRTLSNRVETERTNTQDVTEEYTDLEARQNNLRKQEEAYGNLLSQATDIEDILNIQRELTNVRSQIEFITGRIQYLDNRTSYSQISVSLKEETTLNIPNKTFQPSDDVNEAINTLIRFGQWVATGFIWLAVFGVGAILPLILIIWAGKKIIEKRK